MNRNKLYDEARIRAFEIATYLCGEERHVLEYKYLHVPEFRLALDLIANMIVEMKKSYPEEEKRLINQFKSFLRR